MKKKKIGLLLIALLVVTVLLVSVAAAAPPVKTLATPQLLYPKSDQVFNYYPRTLTLQWKAVPGATGYLVEWQYSDPTSKIWADGPYDNHVTTIDNWFTFNFVGAQPGRWHVTALGTNPLLNSKPSKWGTFTFLM